MQPYELKMTRGHGHWALKTIVEGLDCTTNRQRQSALQFYQMVMSESVQQIQQQIYI